MSKKTRSRGGVLSSLPFYVTFVYIALILAVFPLYLNSTLYTAMTEAKYQFFRTTAVCFGALLVIWTAVWCAKVRPSKRGFSDFVKDVSISQWAMLGFMLVASLSAAFSQYDCWIGSMRYDGLLTLLLYGVIFLGVSFFGEFRELYGILFSCACVLMCLLGISQYFGHDIVHIYPQGYSFFNSNFISTLGNINMVGGYSAISIPFLAMLVTLGEKKYSYAYLIPLALSASLLRFSNVDSGIVGCMVCAVVVPPFVLTSAKRIKRFCAAGIAFCLAWGVSSLFTVSYESFINVEKYNVSAAFGTTSGLMFALAAVLAAALAAVTFMDKKGSFNFSKKTLTRVFAIISIAIVIAGLCTAWICGNYPDRPSIRLLYEAGQIMRGNFDDNFGSYRMIIWKNALKMAFDNPKLFGSGPDTFTYEFEYATRGVALPLEGQIFDFAHNEYIQILCNLGVLALAAYLVMFFYQAALAVKYRGEDSVIPLLAAPVLGYMTHLFFSFNISILAPILWVLLGMLCFHTRAVKKRLREKKAETPEADK